MDLFAFIVILYFFFKTTHTITAITSTQIATRVEILHRGVSYYAVALLLLLSSSFSLECARGDYICVSFSARLMDSTN